MFLRSSNNTHRPAIGAASRSAALMTVLVVAVSALGCGGGFDRVPVTGKVTLNGEPLEEGVITFSPIDAPGPKARTDIFFGEYKFDSATGPAAGKMRVEITAAEAEPESLERDIRNGEKPALHSVSIPAKYNKNSTLEVDVTDAGTHEHSFQLENKSNVN